MSEQIPITFEGKRRLEEELKQLKSVERPKVIKAIAEARAHGDLSENAEYDAARERQAFVEGRILEVEDKIARANVIDPSLIKTDKIVFGATVEVKILDTDEMKTFYIVGTEEADVKRGRLSIESPIARQLLNKRAGDVISIKIPRGEVEYEIISVEYR